MDLFSNPSVGTTGNSNSETQFYEQLFRSFDTQNFGTVQGGQVFGFFLSSGLNKAALGDIWDEATQKQSGGLSLPKFINAMKLIALAQKGIPPKLQNVSANTPIPTMQYPSHIKKPSLPSQSQQSSHAQPAQAQAPPAEPDPFGGLTQDLGFGDVGKSSNGNLSNPSSSAKPSGPSWGDDTLGASNAMPTGTPSVPNTNSANITISTPAANTNIDGGYDYDSPKSVNDTNNNVNVNVNVNGNNEYAPNISHHHHHHISKQASLGPMTMTMGIGGIGGIGGKGGDVDTVNSVNPPGLNRRISTKILYQEERLREQIRQAEQREKLAKKQANTQRIENERLERENEGLKLEINAARQAQADALTQSQEALTSIQPLRVENEKLKQAINQWKELIQTKDEELEALEAEVDQLRLENEKLENVLRDDKSKVDDIQFKLERSDALLQELKTKNRENELIINELKQEKNKLEDEKRDLDLRVVQIKDEMKKLKRNQNSGLGINDRNVLKKKEESLFNINDIALTTTSNNKLSQPIASDNDDKPVSDDDDTGIVPPGTVDFNFTENDNNQIKPQQPAIISDYNDINIDNGINENDDGGEDVDNVDNDDEPDMIDKVIEEKVEIEQDVIKTVLIDDEYKSSEWFMSAQDVKKYHQFFEQADTNKDGVIDGGEANKFFTKSKLSRKLLAKIWVLADQEKKGKLSEPMFCVMFHIVMKIKKSGNKLSVPSVIPECLSVAVVEKLGTKIQKTVKEKKWITQKKTIKVPNPNKKNKKKKSKKKKTPPPLPTDDNIINNINNKDNNKDKDNDNALDFGNDGWGNDFSFDTEEPATTTTAKATTTSSTTDNNASASSSSAAVSTQPPQESTQNDDNWNDFGSFFDQ